MAEMMIAIIILGLGLLMVATMFPVAWTRARDLAEFTNQTTATHAAEATVRMLCGVSTVPNATSFLGDTVVVGGAVLPLNDTSVHVLHVENGFADPATVLATGMVSWPELVRSTALDPAAPARREYLEQDPRAILWWDHPFPGLKPPGSQIGFHERLIPPLPPRPVLVGPVRTQWEQQLANRRFAWAVLHRIVGTASSIDDVTFYFVTLRRTQSTHRFARQLDYGPGPTPPTPWIRTTEPKAMGPEEDMLFPVPWLVNLKIVGSWQADGTSFTDATGIPAEAIANPGENPNPDSRLIPQMLQRGSMIIDRLTGNVYTVRQHRYTGTGDRYDHQATLTLDREITAVDLGIPAGASEPKIQVGAYDDADILLATLGGDLRGFWVFPPPVARGVSGDEEYPVFDGKQPVVGIETR